MELHYHRTGSGPTLIILHGLFGTWENWGAQIKMLSDQFDIVAADLRNHGSSPHSDAVDYRSMAGDVIELMDRLEIEHAFILGHSMGGKVAMQLAIDHPSRVDKLIVADIAPVTYPPHHNAVFQGLLNVDLNTIKSRTNADQQLAEHVDSAGVRAFLLKNLQRDAQGRFAWKMNLESLHREYDHIAAAPSEGQYTGPVLFIKGGDSDYLLPEHAEAIKTRFPNASYKVIEGTGHWLHAEKPGAFTRLVERFLAHQA
ncbi:Esterase ybfF [Marinobacterium lacunae]|uniref:Esterase ybfF n=1 Tax=Marinobacterium lacunae TaxID=1232683 RepID=A0A081G3V6_9GAMM|nr:alpha/beta fold hydrolase [Marinobacterium lacunae]KEA65461.1 Esterase ybfF [Marinobacterium lacunae]